MNGAKALASEITERRSRIGQSVPERLGEKLLYSVPRNPRPEVARETMAERELGAYLAKRGTLVPTDATLWTKVTTNRATNVAAGLVTRCRRVSACDSNAAIGREWSNVGARKFLRTLRARQCEVCLCAYGWCRAKHRPKGPTGFPVLGKSRAGGVEPPPARRVCGNCGQTATLGDEPCRLMATNAVRF